MLFRKESSMDRRAFTALLPTLAAALASAQTSTATEHLETLASGVFPPQPYSTQQPGRTSRRLILGRLPDNIRCEAHVTTIEPGTPHESLRKHLHSEIWYMIEGTALLHVNGHDFTMNAGDMGLVAAGDFHWVANVSNARCSYLVLTAGLPEPSPLPKEYQ
jgi:mannose-6-phosphate isomerase-like protein (cupin superfamily)